MCGIVGVFSRSSQGVTLNQQKAMYNLMLADTVRGVDGTGFFFVKEDKGTPKVWYYKKAVTAPELLDRGGFIKMTDGARIIVAHNRAATLGKVDDESTHPFIHDHVTGVHNGTVRAWKFDLQSYDVDKCLLDSDAVIKALSEEEPDKVEDVLTSIEAGAYSLVWYDKRVDELRLARNGERPMCFLESGESTFFGSELAMLEWCVGRNGLALKTGWSNKKHTLLRIPFAGGKATIKDYSDDVPSHYSGSYSSNYGSNYNSMYPYMNDFSSDSLPGTSYNSFHQKTPRWIDVRTMSTLDTVAGVGAEARTNMYEVTEAMLGSKLVPSSYKPMTEVLTPLMVGKAFGASIDRFNSLTVSFFCVEMTPGGEMFGYIERDGNKELAEPMVAYNKTWKKEIQAILDKGKVARIDNVGVIGLRLYASGDVGWRLGPADTTATQLVETDTTLDKDTKFMYGEAHPAILVDTVQDHEVRALWNSQWKDNQAIGGVH